QQFAEAKHVPEKDKEHWAVLISANTAIAMGLRVNEGSSIAFIVDEKSNGDMYFAQTADVGIGLGTPAIGGGISGAYFSDVNKPEDLNGWTGTLGVGFSVVGTDLHTNFGKDKKFFAGIRLNISKGIKMDKIFNIKYFKGEGHISGDYSHVIWSKKINDDNDGKYIKEQLEKVNPNYKNEVNLETVEFISNYLIENRDKIYKKTEFDKAYDRLKKLRAEGYYD
ncbi:hemolysin, partial [Fusobacterium watanabei]